MNVLKNRFLKRAIAFSMTAVMTVSVSVMAFAEDGTGTQWTRLTRKEQPKVSYEFAQDELGVVNFAPEWGNKEANIESMISYVEEAHEKGVKILLFPEMCVTGYAYSNDPDSEVYQMAVQNAEPLDGPTAQNLQNFPMNMICGLSTVQPRPWKEIRNMLITQHLRVPRMEK